LKKLSTILIISILLTFGCNNAKYITVKHVKPINRSRFYHPKKDKRKKKVKYVKVKILKKSPIVKPAKTKVAKVKKSKLKDDNSIDEIVEPTNEADSTGTL
jgi:hypothetical protein